MMKTTPAEASSRAESSVPARDLIAQRPDDQLRVGIRRKRVGMLAQHRGMHGGQLSARPRPWRPAPAG